MLFNIYIIIYDVYKFFKKNIMNIFVLSILSATINIILQYMLNINKTDLSILYQINFFKKPFFSDLFSPFSINQKKVIFYMKCIKMTCFVVSSSFLYTSIIYLVKSLSFPGSKKCFYVIKKTSQSFFFFIPIIGLQYLLITLPLNYFLIPKILLSIFLSIFPIIFFFDKIDAFSALKDGIRVIKKNIYIVIPIIILCRILKFFIMMLFKFFFVFSIYTNIFILNVILNLGLSYIIMCLFRLYIFQKQRTV